MFSMKPDFDQVLERYEAWWDCQIVDRPPVWLTWQRPENERVGEPAKEHTTLRERWMDAEFQVACVEERLHNTVHDADALPLAWPNLGPDVFAAWYGCPLAFGETTSWSEPILHGWDDASVAGLQLDMDGLYFRKIMEMTDALVDAGKGRFIVGYTDLHGGADAIAAFRDPQQLCIDMVEHPAEVQALCDRITGDFLRVYDVFHERLSAAGMPSITWMGCPSRGRHHVPSNDFSCMISDQMFQDVFLSGIIRECRHMDRCIYHLDGPQALRYLDTLLAMPEIHAIQWVPGAGQDDWKRWIEVYQRIQAAGKAFVVSVPPEDLGRFFEVLRPEGAWLRIESFEGARDEADQLLADVARWGR